MHRAKRDIYYILRPTHRLWAILVIKVSLQYCAHSHKYGARLGQVRGQTTLVWSGATALRTRWPSRC